MKLDSFLCLVIHYGPIHLQFSTLLPVAGWFILVHIKVSKYMELTGNDMIGEPYAKSNRRVHNKKEKDDHGCGV